MDILINIFLYGYLPFFTIFVVMGIWELIKGHLEVGKRDMLKDPDGILAFEINFFIGIVPVINIVGFIMLICDIMKQLGYNLILKNTY